MNILLVSQCSKNALVETRRILDQFAERRGVRTWQTPITQAGLETLYCLLRKTARKNTSVACHWIRGKNHSELLWIVGDARQFNEQGATPTNSTQHNVLRTQDENDWHAAIDIRLLAQLAALFHDLGKASQTFQKKLQSAKPLADPFRHEWVSLRLFEAFVGKNCVSDQDWLQRLAHLDGSETHLVLQSLIQDQPDQNVPGPFRTLHEHLPLARLVGWLIVSHHRLPTHERKSRQGEKTELDERSLRRMPAGIAHGWCGSRLKPTELSSKKEQRVHAEALQGCWLFPGGLPFESGHWREHVAKVAQALLARNEHCGVAMSERLLADPYVPHHARLVLMLADHYYSAQPSHTRYGDPIKGKKNKNKTLYANTRTAVDNTHKRVLNQRLDEHLIGVEVNAGRLMRSLPRLANTLPRIARHRGMRKRAKGLFAWQNHAFDLAESLREPAAVHGFFGVNLASTGRGKTLANARILYALANPQRGARFTVALGLRTLTLQTGDAYRERLHLGLEDLAVLVGGTATRALHQHYQSLEQAVIAAGSESAQSLLPGHDYVRYEGSLEEGPLKHWLRTPKRQGSPPTALLNAPVLVCTIDHLMPATEGTRGGHQILPMLRLMTADLVLDEPDDFDVADLPALTRLVYWTGLLGSRVLLSSATLAPSLVQGLFLAYRAGREAFQRYRGEPNTPLNICCAWFDEFGRQAVQHGADAKGLDFLASHNQFIDQRVGHLKALQVKEVRRRAAILPTPVELPPTIHDTAGQLTEIGGKLALLLRNAALELHNHHHATDPITQARVSFGLIRMANIDPLSEVALALSRVKLPEKTRIHLCVYHSQHPMLVRAAIEHILDDVLKRHDPGAIFQHKAIRHTLDERPAAENHLFIVLATAVAEVGRDHDYDWAIVEPSSMRSIIQLAGRVQRHRAYACPQDQPNILLLEYNIKALRGNSPGTVFCHPGFEGEGFVLESKGLHELLTPEQWQIIDACPRIRPRPQLEPHTNLADLEHLRLHDLMLGAPDGGMQKQPPVHWWWTTQAHFSGILQAHTRFREDTDGASSYVFLPDDEGTQAFFYQLAEDGREVKVGNLLVELASDEVFSSDAVSSWATPDYLEALTELAESHSMDLASCARKFGIVDLPGRDGTQRWRYHPMLGFSRYP